MRGWIALACAGCAGSTPGPADTDTDVLPASRYAAPDAFLCHPDGAPDDQCAPDRVVTVVEADGSATELVRTLDPDAPADCFYVYPTASLDPTPNADFEPDAGERFMTRTQAAHYGSVCRVFAPVYRQVSLNGLFAGGDFELAYGDVLEAFEATVGASDRPFLLVGHSQGTAHLARLIAERIEGDAALTERFVAAHLLGGFVTVPTGQVAGGSFASTPLCTSPDETGCVVHAVSFASDDPPGEDAFFGRADAGSDVACVSAADLLGRGETLAGVFAVDAPAGATVLGGIIPGPYADEAANPVSTELYAVPGLLTGACTSRDGARFLEITVHADPADPRADDVPGRAPLLPGWGLHLVDVGLQADDLTELAARQIAAQP